MAQLLKVANLSEMAAKKLTVVCQMGRMSTFVTAGRNFADSKPQLAVIQLPIWHLVAIWLRVRYWWASVLPPLEFCGGLDAVIRSEALACLVSVGPLTNYRLIPASCSHLPPL